MSLLRVELRNDGVSEVVEAPLATGPSAEARIRVERPRCAADDTSVVLHLVDPLTDKSLARGVDLASTAPAARTRLLALAAAELVRASWAEVAAERRRAVIGSVTRLGDSRVQVQVNAFASLPLPPLAATPDDPLSQGFSLGPTLELRHHLRHPGGLWSLGARATQQTKSMQLAWDIRGAFGTEDDPRGNLNIAAVIAGGSLQLRAQTRTVSMGLGPRLDAGFAWAGGSNAGTSVTSQQGSAPVLQLGLELELGLNRGTWSPHATLRAGETLAGIGVTADGRRLVGIDGPYLAIAFGADWGL